MFIERLTVKSFRHIKDAEIGPFRRPAELSELIVLAGPNGGGKSSVLELLSYGLCNRYSWQYYESRRISNHSFAVKIGLTQDEIERVVQQARSRSDINDFVQMHRGYWMQVNLTLLNETDDVINQAVHAIVSKEFSNFTRRLGFFIRPDRGYSRKSYNQQKLFNWQSRLHNKHFNSISYSNTEEQYTDMYDFLVEQSYHYVYQLGQYHVKLESGQSGERPVDPLMSYNSLMDQLFPGYELLPAEPSDLSVRVHLPTGDVIPFQDLSSGEKEVFFILSFFLRHNVSNSIIIIDEPELHLHAELARRLLQIMRSIRPHNQLWCATHNADLIDEAGRERTFFLRVSDDRRSVECIRATDEGAETRLLRDMFGYAGYVGISKKVVFLEGDDSSADRITFTSLFPDHAKSIRLIPVGSASNLYRINRAILALLEEKFARCEFYLIRDRDYLSDAEVKKHKSLAEGRLFILRRYHIENYLVEENTLSELLHDIYRIKMTPEQVQTELRNIARANSAGFLRDLAVARFAELYRSEDCGIGANFSGQSILDAQGRLNEIVAKPLREALLSKMVEVQNNIDNRTQQHELQRLWDESADQMVSALNGSDGHWKELVPGRYILQRFSNKHSLGAWPSLQNMLIQRLSEQPSRIDPELVSIFSRIST